MSAGIVGLDIFNQKKVEELTAREDGMKAKTTQVLFETDIYPTEYASYLIDAIEVDSSDRNTQLYTGKMKPSLYPGYSFPDVAVC